MTITTERLVLRQLAPGDAKALFKVMGDRENMKHYPYIFDEARIDWWISRNLERYRILGFGLWAVCLKTTGELIGDCGLTMQNIDGTICPEIGYHIRRDLQKQGFATEAACAVRDWAFENTTFKMLYSYMGAANEPSARTAAAYGCTLLREYVTEEGAPTKVFAITREEWLKKKSQEALA